MEELRCEMRKFLPALGDLGGPEKVEGNVICRLSPTWAFLLKGIYSLLKSQSTTKELEVRG